MADLVHQISDKAVNTVEDRVAATVHATNMMQLLINSVVECGEQKEVLPVEENQCEALRLRQERINTFRRMYEATYREEIDHAKECDFDKKVKRVVKVWMKKLETEKPRKAGWRKSNRQAGPSGDMASGIAETPEARHDMAETAGEVTEYGDVATAGDSTESGEVTEPATMTIEDKQYRFQCTAASTCDYRCGATQAYCSTQPS
jgi:hypothetical protein